MFAILGTFYLATAADKIKGEQWYPQAWETCSRLAAEYKADPYSVAGIVAALSPRNKWSRNITDAENLLKVAQSGTIEDARQVKVCTFNSGKEKALRIIESRETDPAAIQAILNGPKLVEFFNCIADVCPDVCIDGHAYSVWAGDRITLNKVPQITPKLRARIKADYISAADRLGISPSTLQAITWVTWRRLHLGTLD